MRAQVLVAPAPVASHPLEQANDALLALATDAVQGAAVLDGAGAR